MARSRTVLTRAATSKSPSRCGASQRKAATASWKSLAAEDLEGTSSTLPIGKCFWPLSQHEKRDVEKLFADKQMHRLATHLRSRDDNWRSQAQATPPIGCKGCSSLGRLRATLFCCTWMAAAAAALREVRYWRSPTRERGRRHTSCRQKRRIFRHDHQPPQSGRPRAALQDRW